MVPMVRSALRYLAAFLRANNPLIRRSAYVVEECKEALEDLREASTEPGLVTDMERLIHLVDDDGCRVKRCPTYTEVKFDNLFPVNGDRVTP